MYEKIGAKIEKGQVKRHRLHILLKNARFSVAGVFPLDYTVACTVNTRDFLTFMKITLF